MAKPGPKKKSAEILQMTGTDQKCRHREAVVIQLEGEPIKPKWLKGMASKVWDTKVERYQLRGQKVVGTEDTLAQYCALEADLIDFRKKKIVPPVAMINQHRIYGNEFYDTPASQQAPTGGSKDNKFKKNGR